MLLRTAALAADRSLEAVRDLAHVLLVSRGGRARSFLNNDGSPLQVCVGMVGGRSGVRLIGDPGADLGCPHERLDAGRRAVGRMLPLASAVRMRLLCERTLDATLPHSHTETAPLRNGSIWIGVGLNTPGLALYTNPAWGDIADRADRAGRWLDAMLSCTGPARATLARISIPGALASLGVEGTGPEDARVKIYWRLTERLPIREFGIAPLIDPAVDEFLWQAMGERGVPMSGVVFCVGFSVATGALEDAKVDLCAHCIPRAPREWLEIIRRASGGGLPPVVEEALLVGPQCEVALVGLGVDRHGVKRVNIYLKATQGAN